MLNQAIVFITFASLALTKMNCERLANYFMIPVFLALFYSNIAAYELAGDQSSTNQNHSTLSGDAKPLIESETRTDFTVRLLVSSNQNNAFSPGGLQMISDGDKQPTAFTESIGNSSSTYLPTDAEASAGGGTIMGSIELLLHNFLGLMALIQLSANMLALRGPTSGSIASSPPSAPD